MAFSIDLTATQIQRVKDATDIRNALDNTSLTAKQFAKLALKETVVGYLAAEAVNVERASSLAKLEGEWA